MQTEPSTAISAPPTDDVEQQPQRHPEGRKPITDAEMVRAHDVFSRLAAAYDAQDRRTGSPPHQPARHAARRGSHPPRERAGAGQDDRRVDPRRRRERVVRAHPVHAGPAAERHRRHPGLRPVDTASSAPGSARSTPTSCSSTRSTGRAPRPRARRWRRCRSVRRSIGGRDVPAARAVHGAGDAEPDRGGGHLPPPAGAARSVPAQGGHRLPDPGRGARGARPDRPRRARRPTPRSPRASSTYRMSCSSSTSRRGCTSTRRSCATPSRSPRRPATRRRSSIRSSAATSSSAPAPVARSRSSRLGRALALMNGRTLSFPTTSAALRHWRSATGIRLGFQAIADDVRVETIIDAIFAAVPTP